MGNTSTNKSFQGNVTRPGLNQNEQLNPKNGVIETEDILTTLRGNPEYENVKKRLENKETLNFNEFLDLTYQDILDKRRNFKNVEIEVNEPQVSCFICPYPQIKKKNQKECCSC